MTDGPGPGTSLQDTPSVSAACVRRRACAAVIAVLAASAAGLSHPPRDAGAGAAYVLDDGSQLRAGNTRVELVFDGADGRLVSVIDKAAGVDFITDKSAYWGPWHAWITLDGVLTNIFGGQATEFFYDRTTTATGRRLVLGWRRFQAGGPLDLDVTVTIDVPDAGSVTYWQIGIVNRTASPIRRIDFPDLHGVGHIGAQDRDELLVLPSMSGLLFQNPLGAFAARSGYGWELYYPSAYASMQMMAYYSLSRGSGLYVAAHDPEANVKFFNVGLPGPTWLSMSVAHPLSLTATTAVALPFPVAVGVFSGDWYDAAQLYRDWALRQSWVRRGTLAQNHDVPQWFKDLHLHQWVYTYPGCIDFNRFSLVPEVAADSTTFMGAPVAIDWIGWEKSGWYIRYPEVLPPKEGWSSFSGAAAAVHRVQGHVMVLPNVASYSSLLPGWAQAQEAAIVDDTGRWPGEFRYEECGESTLFRQMCPATAYWQATLRELLGSLADGGVDVVHLDGFPLLPPGALCASSGHSHPPGGGAWWAAEYRALLEAAKLELRSKNPGLVFSAEGMAEPFMTVLDSVWDPFSSGWSPSSLGLDSSSARLVPLWHAVYHDYHLVQSGISHVSKRGPTGAVGFGDYRDYYLRAFGLALTWGEVPTTWYADEKLSELDDDQEREMAEYLRRIVQARKTYANQFLVYGKMLRPPHLRVPDVTIAGARDIPYSLADFPPFTSTSILASAWLAPSSDVGYVLTNISQRPVRLELPVDSAGTGLSGDSRYWLRPFKNGTLLPQAARGTLPLSVTLDLDPRDVSVVVVSPEPPPRVRRHLGRQ